MSQFKLRSTPARDAIGQMCQSQLFIVVENTLFDAFIQEESASVRDIPSDSRAQSRVPGEWMWLNSHRIFPKRNEANAQA